MLNLYYHSSILPWSTREFIVNRKYVVLLVLVVYFLAYKTVIDAKLSVKILDHMTSKRKRWDGLMWQDCKKTA